MNKIITRTLVFSLLGAILVGCGGGGGGGGTGSSDSNQPPSNNQNPTNTNPAPVILPGPIPANSPNPPTGDAYAMSLAIPPRQQWYVNDGYCGEVSFISAGLYYGQYVSQYTARAAATPGVNESVVNSQLLIAVNDLTAAANMHLNAVEWNGQSNSATTSQYLAWVKGYVLAGYPVIIGIYVNQSPVDSGNTASGFSSYDHIVPVNGVASNHPLVPGFNQIYYADDILQFSDNSGNSSPTAPYMPDPPLADFLFQYDFGPFQMTRTEANAPTAPTYSLALHTDSNTTNAAVAITGVVDPDNETVPVRLATNLDYESPSIASGSNIAPASESLTLTATVYGLTTGVSYNVYEYNSLASIPNSAFNANASAAYQTFTFTATGSTYVLPAIAIQSSQVAAFRAVPASGK